MATTNKKVIIKKKKSILATPDISEQVIEFKNTKEKGDAYEIFIKHFLIDSEKYKMVHLWKDVPESDLFASGIMDDWNLSRLRRKASRKEGLIGDIGTDLLVMDNSGKYSIVQCKFYDVDCKLRIEDLGTFYFMMMNYRGLVNGIVYHTCKLSSLLESHSTMNNIIQYNHQTFNPSRYLELQNTIYSIKSEETFNKILKLYDYQIEAINALRGKQRTICQIPCGCGKTLIGIALCKDFKQNIIIAPLKSYCEQNLERYKSQLPNYEMIIIDSDNDGRNLDNINKFIKEHDKICIFATFKSVDIINNLIKNNLLKTDEYYVIIDEFHNISINDILEDEETEDHLEMIVDELEDDSEDNEIDIYEEEMDYEETDNTTEMYKLLHSNAKILFMSATPKLMGNNVEYSEDCEIDDEIFGNIDYKMDMRNAINSGKICDYTIYVPTLSIEKTVGLDKIQEEVNIKNYDKELVIKARFILRGMMNNGSRKCIIYLQTKEECRKMNTILEDIGKNYFSVDINSNYIISDSSKEERKTILKEFASKEGYNFLCSVDILNECIDIPECDSIFIAYPSKSKIRNIQRVCRANRKDMKNLDKVARIYVWADEYKDELVDFIGHMKEYDSGFGFNKIKRLNVNGQHNAVMKIDDNIEENKTLEGFVVGVKNISGWLEKLDIAEKCIIRNNNKRPTKNGTKEDIQVNGWLSRQINDYNKYKNVMKIEQYRFIFLNFMNKYIKLFETHENIWINNKNLLVKYIKDNGNLPIISNENTKAEIKLIKYIERQKQNIRLKRGLVIKEPYHSYWQQFCIQFPILNITYEDICDQTWRQNQIECRKFMIVNSKRPSSESKNINEAKLGRWLSTQNQNFKNKTFVLKNEYLFNEYGKLIDEFEHIKINNNLHWLYMIKKHKAFLQHNTLKPNIKNGGFEAKLDRWFDTNNKYFNKKIFRMKDNEDGTENEYYIMFKEHIKEFYELLSTNEEKWWNIAESLEINYLSKGHKPLKNKLDKEESSHAQWIATQHNNSKTNKESMSFLDRRQKWKELRDKYKILLMTENEDCIYKLQLVMNYMDLCGKRPSKKQKGLEGELGTFIGNIKKSYKIKKGLIFEKNVKPTFDLLMTKYSKYITFDD